MADLEMNDQPEFIGITDDDTDGVEPNAAKDAPLTAAMLESILADQNRRNEQLVRAVTQKGTPLQPDNEHVELAISYEGLPNPAMDPEGYHREYTKRMQDAANAALRATVQKSREAAQEVVGDNAVSDRAYGMIRDVAPDLPDELIGVAAQAVSAQIRADGGDPRLALRQDTEGVAQRILDYADDLVSRATGQGSPNRTASPNRTGGMLAPRNRRPAAPKPKEGPGDMYAEMKAEQKRLRIY